MATNAAPATNMTSPQPQTQTPSSSRPLATACTTMSSGPGRAPCSLLRLPAELLQQIYYYLPLGTPSYPRLLTRDTWMQAAPSHATPALQTPPLARTCRRLRADILALYLGHLRVELSDDNELDGVFLERCLRALGSAVLHVRKLTVEHKIDICVDEGTRDVVRKRAETAFEVKGVPAGEGSQAPSPGSVEVTCTFERTTLLGDVRLPEDSNLCDCPISTHLEAISSRLSATTQTTSATPSANSRNEDASHPSTSDSRIFPCPLTTSILTFLTLIDISSSTPGLETRPRYQQQQLSSAPYAGFLGPLGTPTPSSQSSSSSNPDNPTTKWWPWPLCPVCNRKKYLLQGPITGPCLTIPGSHNSPSSTNRGGLGYVNYAGHRWISCPYVPAKQSMEHYEAEKYSSGFKCRWGPTRPRLVRPYGAKSRALLRQEREFLFN